MFNDQLLILACCLVFTVASQVRFALWARSKSESDFSCESRDQGFEMIERFREVFRQDLVTSLRFFNFFEAKSNSIYLAIMKAFIC